MIGGKTFNKFYPFDPPGDAVIKLTTFDRHTAISSLLDRPWRTASDLVNCQRDLIFEGKCCAVMRGGRMEHVPVEMFERWRESERDWYAESG